MPCLRSEKHHELLKPAPKHIQCTEPGEMIFIDHIGPWAKGQYGFDKVLVVLDAFSKFTQDYTQSVVRRQILQLNVSKSL